jgi:maltose alpha-D-glucosyltransferase/alpha-amylase
MGLGSPNEKDQSRVTIDDLWYKNAIIYCLDVGQFMDTNQDGVGDFDGLTRRLDYLAGLGVTCLWLLPFQSGPNRDNGYDISDYYSVDRKHGTLGDFVEFANQARQRGIRVIIDLVVNHTSDQHPWFKSARSDPKSKYRDWYVWSKTKPKDANKGMVFPGVQKATWTWDKEARAYYFHRFYEFQPDLDTENPEVRAEIRRIMGFWLELGVSGFRIDAVPFTIQNKGAHRRHTERFEMLHEMRTFLQWRAGDAILLGEANVLPEDDLHYFGHVGERMQMMFNFMVNQHVFYALATGDARTLAKALTSTRRMPEHAQWGHFLRNNDELDLGRLTARQRERVFRAFGPDKDMQLYRRGIRRRLAPMLENDRRRLEVAYSLLFTLPGTPVIRYGDELGMGDDLALKERDCGRTPMQWSNEPHGGFTDAEKPVLPVISGGLYGYERVNAAIQRRDPDSLLNWTERMIRMRKECPEFGWGEWRILSTGTESVLAMLYEWRGNALVALHNFANSPQQVTMRVPGVHGHRLVSLLSEEHSKSDAKGVHTIELEAYGYRWFRVGGLRYILERART